MADITRRELLAGIPLMMLAPIKAGAGTPGCDSPSELWDLTLSLDVPRIYDNMTSQGSRKYQRQRIKAQFGVFYGRDVEPEIRFYEMYNKTHKVGGQPVTYDTISGSGTLWHGIGSNKTGKFNTRSVKMVLEAMPSYAIGPAPDEDNSLLVTLAGRGYANGKRLRGSVAGQLGCGCYEYGHVSPTRIWGQSRVVDTAAVFGSWAAKRIA